MRLFRMSPNWGTRQGDFVFGIHFNFPPHENRVSFFGGFRNKFFDGLTSFQYGFLKVNKKNDLKENDFQILLKKKNKNVRFHDIFFITL